MSRPPRLMHTIGETALTDTESVGELIANCIDARLDDEVILIRQADKHRRSFNIRTAIDVVVTVVSTATLVWYFVLEPYAPATMSVSLFGSEALSPVLQIVMLSVVAHILLQTSARQPSHVYALGLLFLVASDLSLMFLVHDATAMDLIMPLTWTAGVTIFFIDVQRKPEFPPDAAATQPLPTATIVPYVMATLAIATLLFGDNLFGFNRIADAQGYLIGLGLLAMLLMRQVISLRDNRHLIHELVQTNRKLYNKATTDHVTGLLNRTAFTQRLHEFVHSETAGCLLFIDLNRFKAVNDTYGHAAGDVLLQSIANRITHRLEPDWIASRAGGDEYMVALPGATPDGATLFAKELQAALEQPHYIGPEYLVSVTVAVGIAHYPTDGTDLDTVIDCADQRMYQVKRSMKDRAPTTEVRSAVL